MATTANNGWTIPADTDLVRNGAAAMRTLGNAIDTTVGAWQTYTPTIGTDGGTTNWTLGNGTCIGRYQRIADVVHFEIKFALGSTSAKGNAGITFSLPVTSNSYIEPNWYTGIFFDQSLSDYYPLMCRISSNIVKPYTIGTTLSSITATAPVTVATSDFIVCNGSYAV